MFTANSQPLLLGLYAACLAALCPVRPFWVDELLQLLGTRDLSGLSLFNYVRAFPGAAPLGYLIQHWGISFLGASSYSARFTSAFFSLASCLLLTRIARKLQIGPLWFLLICWMILPLQLRYALEARPYAQALFFSVLSTLAFLNLFSKPGLTNSVAYCLALIGGIYSAPYTLFLQLGYLAWLAFARHARLFLYAAVAIACAASSYVPWYVWSLQRWNAYLMVTKEVGFRVSPKFLLLPVQEISGGGYVCSIALILLAGVGCWSRQRRGQPWAVCLCLGMAASFLCTLLVDAVFNYFFAIRQIMFLLVPLVLLAADGVGVLLTQKRTQMAAFVLVAALFVGSIVKNVRYFSDRSEDWGAAAAALHSDMNRGVCPRFNNQQDPKLYAFYEPALLAFVCPVGSAVAVANTRYTQHADRIRIEKELQRSGYHAVSVRKAGIAEIVTFIAR